MDPARATLIGAVRIDDSLLLLELGAILVVLAILSRLAARFRLSPIPLFLLLGLAFGAGGLFPVITSEGFIRTGAEIGVILLLFMLGLEYSARELLANVRRSTAAGLMDAIVNFTPGFLGALVLGWGWLPAVFLGGVTYVSSSGIISRLLQETGWSREPEGKVVVSILVIEDLVMAGYLAVTAVLVSGRGPVIGGVSVALALAIVALVLWIAVRFGPRFSKLVFSRTDQALILAIIGITLVAAGLADKLQISAEVGAFLIGLMLSGATAHRARTLLGPLRDLFSAFFFLFFGFAIDPAAIPAVLPAAMLLALVGGLGKVFTGWWSARRAGVEPRGRIHAGVSLIPRGEFSVAIAGIAVVAGLQPDLAPLAAAYVLVLAVVAPLIVAWLHRRHGGKAPRPSMAPDQGRFDP